MSRRSFSFRAVIVSSIVGLALALIPLATVLADGMNGTFPR
jgi:orotate phosphoribosyltransferase-like protein